MENIHIRFNNWDDYQTRKDVDKMRWIRIEVDVFEDPKTFDFTATERLGFISLLMIAGKMCKSKDKCAEQNWLNGTIKCDITYLAHYSKLTKEQMHNVIDKLVQLQIVHRSVQIRTDPCLEKKRKEEKRKENNTKEKKILTSTKLTSVDDFLSMWNEFCYPLSKVKKLSEKRKRALMSRLKEEPKLDYWKQTLERIVSSEFCTGQTKGSNWIAGFDWFIKPDTHIMVNEGKYDNRKKQNSQNAHLRGLFND